jgi:glycosyltransferase involved in cell wall biosynthesis
MTNNNIMVSVSMITYKHELYIREAIEGVLMQKVNFIVELIIADDCSPDNTSTIVQEIIENHPNGHWIKYFKHEKNIGMQANGLFAAEQCTGKYVACCEGDDYWTDPLKLQKQVDFLEENEEFVLCFHSIKILELNGNLVEDYITKVPKNYKTIENLATKGNYIHTPSVVFRNILTSLPEEYLNSPTGDLFLYIILGQYGNYKFLDETMAVYRYNNLGIWSRLEKIDKILNSTLTMLLLCKYFERNNSELVNIFKIRIKKNISNYSNLISKNDIDNLRNDKNISILIDEILLSIIEEKNGILNKYSKKPLIPFLYFTWAKIINIFKKND